MRVVAANSVEVSRLVEVAHRVATEQRKSLRIRQLIPEHFKMDGRFLLTVFPQNVDHLTVDPGDAIRLSPARPVYDLTHAVPEPRGIGPAVCHEQGEMLLRIE